MTMSLTTAEDIVAAGQAQGLGAGEIQWLVALSMAMSGGNPWYVNGQYHGVFALNTSSGSDHPITCGTATYFATVTTSGGGGLWGTTTKVLVRVTPSQAQSVSYAAGMVARLTKAFGGVWEMARAVVPQGGMWGPCYNVSPLYNLIVANLAAATTLVNQVFHAICPNGNAQQFASGSWGCVYGSGAAPTPVPTPTAPLPRPAPTPTPAPPPVAPVPSAYPPTSTSPTGSSSATVPSPAPVSSNTLPVVLLGGGGVLLLVAALSHSSPSAPAETPAAAV